MPNTYSPDDFDITKWTDTRLRQGIAYWTDKIVVDQKLLDRDKSYVTRLTAELTGRNLTEGGQLALALKSIMPSLTTNQANNLAAMLIARGYHHEPA